ncbi:MAG: hypothetical protein J7K68_05790 [Candidatus Diapherotrites archaeon]|nr:hypothetical protein [Candidatus Diapherotrites archaeon]
MSEIRARRFIVPDMNKIIKQHVLTGKQWDRLHSSKRIWATAFKPAKIPYKKLGIEERDHLVFICGGIGGFAKKAIEDNHYVEYTDISDRVVNEMKRELSKHTRNRAVIRKQAAEELSVKQKKPPLIIGIEPYPLFYDPEASLLMILRILAHGRGGLIIERAEVDKKLNRPFEQYLSELSNIYDFRVEKGDTDIREHGKPSATKFSYTKIIPLESSRVKAFHDLQLINAVKDIDGLTSEELRNVTSLPDVDEVLERIDSVLRKGEKIYKRLKHTKHLEVR